jgi:hypothetical protein
MPSQAGSPFEPGHAATAAKSVRRADLREHQKAHPNEELMRAAIAAFQHGDMDALREKYFAEDIRWHFPGRSPLAGDYEGVAQVLGSFAGSSSSPVAPVVSTPLPATSTPLCRISAAPSARAARWWTAPS